MTGTARRYTLVWLLLLAGTLAGCQVAQARGWGFAIALAAAAAKAWLIVHHYMDLRSAPLGWRVAFDTLILGCAAVIGVIHFAA